MGIDFYWSDSVEISALAGLNRQRALQCWMVIKNLSECLPRAPL